MKKFIFTAYMIALLLLVPAVLIGYLHTGTPSAKAATQEMTSQSNSMEDETLLVRNF